MLPSRSSWATRKTPTIFPTCSLKGRFRATTTIRSHSSHPSVPYRTTYHPKGTARYGTARYGHLGKWPYWWPVPRCRHPGEALPILTRIKHNGVCSMIPNWPVFKKGTQFAKAFWDDTTGVILPYVTIMLLVIVGLSVLALDGARLMSLQTQLQNGADALALAGAAELRPHSASMRTRSQPPAT